jgi:predicted esterase
MRKLIFSAFTLALVGCTETQTTADAGADASIDLADAALMAADDARSEDAFRAPPDAVRSDAGPVRMDPIMPAVRGPCGDFSATGTVMLQGPGGTSRRANIWVSEAAQTLDGPLVFYWHGAGGSPLEAPGVLGPAQAEVLAQGGIVVALTHAAPGSLPWYLSVGAEETDLVFADEAVACAEQELGIDDQRIHGIGFSAGALHLAQMSLRRASYLASVVTYSGGIVARTVPPTDAPDARTAAMALFGGPRDVVLVSFATTTQNYVNALRGGDHFIFTCDHGGGHTVPNAARASAWQFLQAHPYGMFPAAYASGLPAGFYAPCTLD